jgi:hypothetical protein
MCTETRVHAGYDVETTKTVYSVNTRKKTTDRAVLNGTMMTFVTTQQSSSLLVYQ